MSSICGKIINMRADRLLSMLMLLQTRGRMTAGELAKELEVSERTVYRDINALSYSGVPVYAERGPGGGIAIIESYRSDLTGLNKDEVRALFMLSIPPALTELGLDQKLRAAMLKLSAALPATLRGDEQGVRQRIHIDPTPWEQKPAATSASFLHRVHQAVWEMQVLEIQYRPQFRPEMSPIISQINPYGLVSKAGDWHLVARRQDHLIVLAVSRFEAVEFLSEKFERPEDFDLGKFWGNWCQGMSDNRPRYPVVVRVSPEILPNLPYYFGGQIRAPISPAGQPDEIGWVTLEIQFEYHEQARWQLLRLGGWVEVLEPSALRYSIQDFAVQIQMRYD
jgi:predicted DNA-binding transcriptional regulator YafY